MNVIQCAGAKCGVVMCYSCLPSKQDPPLQMTQRLKPGRQRLCKLIVRPVGNSEVIGNPLIPPSSTRLATPICPSTLS